MPLLSSHPSRADLYEFAELLERNAASDAAPVAAHAAECALCAAEIARVRATITVATRAAAIEPRGDFRAQILLSARQERGRKPGRYVAVDWYAHRRSLATASGIVIIASLSLLAVRYAEFNLSDRPESARPSNAAVFSLDVLRQATPEERLLAPAVFAQTDPATPWEASQRRAVNAWDAEIEEALDALESNPACVRAAALVNTNRERLGETLKVLYVERAQ